MIHWLAGWPDRALRDLQDALRFVAELKHPLTTLLADYYIGMVHYQRGEREPAFALFEEANSLSKQYGNPRYAEHLGVVLRCGRSEPLDLDALEGMSAQLMSIRWPTWQKDFALCVLARRFADSGYAEQGRALLRTISQESSATWMAPEMARLEGELLTRMKQPDPDEAGKRMREAIGLARAQESKSLELRATTSLARLLVERGRREEARLELAEIYGWFTEGFDTADLKAARVLLNELGAV